MIQQFVALLSPLMDNISLLHLLRERLFVYMPLKTKNSLKNCVVVPKSQPFAALRFLLIVLGLHVRQIMVHYMFLQLYQLLSLRHNRAIKSQVFSSSQSLVNILTQNGALHNMICNVLLQYVASLMRMSSLQHPQADRYCVSVSMDNVLCAKTRATCSTNSDEK